jgi:hypothetical protein
MENAGAATAAGASFAGALSGSAANAGATTNIITAHQVKTFVNLFTCNSLYKSDNSGMAGRTILILKRQPTRQNIQKPRWTF